MLAETGLMMLIVFFVFFVLLGIASYVALAVTKKKSSTKGDESEK